MMIRVVVLMNKHIHEPLEISVEFLDSQHVRNVSALLNTDCYLTLTIDLFWRVFLMSDSDY